MNLIKIPKIKIKNNGNFYIKFRVNKSLYPYFKKEFITKSFAKQSLNFIKLERALIFKKYKEILELASNSLVDKKFMQLQVNNFNVNILGLESKEKMVIDSKITVANAYDRFKKFYDAEKNKISTKKQTYVTLDLFIELIGKNKFIEDIELYDLIEIKNKIEKLGNRNYKEFKHLSLKEYVAVKNVPVEKRINDGSLKSHIKLICQP